MHRRSLHRCLQSSRRSRPPRARRRSSRRARPAARTPLTASFKAVDPESFVSNLGETFAHIEPGGTVTFTYPTGSSLHNVAVHERASRPRACRPRARSAARSRRCPTPPTAPAGRATCRFDAPGTYDFYCELHPSMVGRVVVRDPAPPPPPPPPPGSPPPPPPPPPSSAAGFERDAATPPGAAPATSLAPAASGLRLTAAQRGDGDSRLRPHRPAGLAAEGRGAPARDDARRPAPAQPHRPWPRERSRSRSRRPRRRALRRIRVGCA